jgi:hypothetical protein
MTLVEAGVDVLVVDTANGHARLLLEMVARLKADPAMTHVQVIGGNIATEARRRSSTPGRTRSRSASGPGSICTTRVVAGVGVPQVTAIFEAARRAGPPASRSSATAGCSTPATSPRRSSPAPTRSCSARCWPAARRAPGSSSSSTASSSSPTAAWAPGSDGLPRQEVLLQGPLLPGRRRQRRQDRAGGDRGAGRLPRHGEPAVRTSSSAACSSRCSTSGPAPSPS